MGSVQFASRFGEGCSKARKELNSIDGFFEHKFPKGDITAIKVMHVVIKEDGG